MSAASPPYTTASLQVSPNAGSVSPRTAPAPKNVSFELLFRESPQYRARLPLRVSIFPHDTTESIVTTVKNFYGLYSGPAVSKGVSFEDQQGNTLIARYENFQSHMVVNVRVIDETPSPGTFNAQPFPTPLTAPTAYSGEGVSSHQPAQQFSRPPSPTSRKRSASPNNQSYHSTSHRGSVNGDAQGDMGGYTSGDGAPGSTSSKNKEQIGTTEISLENIVEGGRRKRAKFESSELPLFAPPQMPATTSNPSVSPARRLENYRQPLPYIQPGQNPFTNPKPLHSPHTFPGATQSGMYTTPSADHRRQRASVSYLPGAGAGPVTGMMPTPDPTVGSCMSEEDKDVAIQLMRLGEMSNISHGRTSASTLDDTFSGRADATSSTGATSEAESESDEEMHAARKQKMDTNGAPRNIYPTVEGRLQPSVEDSDDYSDDGGHGGLMAAPKLKNLKAKVPLPHGSKPKPLQSNKIKAPKSSKPKVKKPTGLAGPMSPNSLPASRKPSISSVTGLPLGSGEDDQPDLSSKPRCQRCRKSKKGCDRQRPCGRCRDAGLPAEMCISEDEGNGRKGRYGRHMGVPLSKDAVLMPPTLLPPAPIAPAMPMPPIFSAQAALDKNKKRKR